MIRSQRLDTLMVQHLKDLQAEARGAPPKHPLIPSGLRMLDRVIFGFTAGEVAIFAARPGIGKTVLATRLAVSFGMRAIPTALYGLEDGALSFARRAISIRARVPGQELRVASLARVEAYLRAQRKIEHEPMYVDLCTDDEGATPSSICEDIKKKAAEQGLKVAIIDHIGELLFPLAGFQGKHDAIGHGLRMIRNVCRVAGVVPIIFVQENRKREDAAYRGAAASLSYIADSAEIEKVARIVGLLSTMEKRDEGDPRPGEFVIDIRKNTNGPKGRVTLDYFPECLTCEDPEPLIFDAMPPSGPLPTCKAPSGGAKLLAITGGKLEPVSPAPVG